MKGKGWIEIDRKEIERETAKERERGRESIVEIHGEVIWECNMLLIRDGSYLHTCMHTYTCIQMHMQIHVHTHISVVERVFMYIHVYAYKERERERTRRTTMYIIYIYTYIGRGR